MTAKKADQRGAVVILGEDDNDRKSIQILVAALRPDLPAGALKPLRKPMALVRKVPPARLPTQSQRVSALLRAYAVKEPIRCVLMHEDADDVEPAHLTLIRKIEDAYRSVPWPVLAVVPAWEMETWWFLFPDALRAAYPSWRRIEQYAGRDVGKIRNAKEELRKAVRPPGAKPGFRSYTETDSILIAHKIVELGLLPGPFPARSMSWSSFLDQIRRM